MRHKNDILNNRLYNIAIYTTIFFITNFWFLVMISPIIIYLYKFEKNISMSLLLLISIIVGPALTTLFSVMGKLVREGEISPTKDFFHFYKLNFFQGLLVGITFNTLIGIVYFDIDYFSSNGYRYLSYLFLVLLLIIIMLSTYVYPIISRYNIKIRYLFKISIILLLKKAYIGLSSVSIVIILLGALRFARLSLIGALFGGSVICHLITMIQKNTIDGLEKEIKDKYSS